MKQRHVEMIIYWKSRNGFTRKFFQKPIEYDITKFIKSREGYRSMEQEESVFLNKFIAALCLHGVTSIPFAGNEFQQGIGAIESLMSEHMDAEQFGKISDMFIRVPVEETYQEIRRMFMNLNGHGISFSGADNPLWTVMTIKMTPYAAHRILKDNTVLDINDELINEVATEFCEAAGV